MNNERDIAINTQPYAEDFGVTHTNHVAPGNIEIPVSEYAKLNHRVGFLEGLVDNLEMLGDDELRLAIERGVKRYQEIKYR